MAFKEFNIDDIHKMNLIADFMCCNVNILMLYQSSNDTLFVLSGPERKYIGCFSGDNTFTFANTRTSVKVNIEYKTGTTFERTIIPTYISLITQLIATNKL